MSARLLAIATNVPAGSMSQVQAATLAAEVSGHSAEQSRPLRAIYRRAGVERRGFVVAGTDGSQEFYRRNGHAAGPTTGARMARYTADAAALAVPACREALAKSGVSAERVTHVVVASCTGFEAPGVDRAMIDALRLAAGVRRTMVGFMGCHAAINALAVASAFAGAEPGAVVLVCCVEVCSLHFSFLADSDRSVANALFADGAAAAVVAGDGVQANGVADAARLVGFAATMLPDSADLMSWRIGDAGFEMSLSARVPAMLAAHLPEWVDGFLGEHSLTRADVGGWAIHPGGPRLVDAVRVSLALSEEAVAPSRDVLREHGNMSSPTTLFIVERLAAARPRPWVALAFGPGLAGEAMLMV